MKTAAIIIIGNEILSGKVKDTNSSYLASELRALGVDLRRISVIPDDIDAIGNEVSSCSESYDYVFTSGGVGPTHDDVTMEGIAKGFGLGTDTNQRLSDVVGRLCSGDVTDAAMKMAIVPEGAELIEVEGVGFPLVVIRNVYVFPGIPEFLVKRFEAIKERFRSTPFMVSKLYVNDEECFIAPYLESVLRKFKGVMVGSYPKVGLEEYKVVVTLESRDDGQLSKAQDYLIGLLPEGSVVKVED
jgi:molybdenum cofactor synthesis domain-containing protein